MKTPLEMVKEYHEKAGLPIGITFSEGGYDLLNMRERLITEEYDEFINELDADEEDGIDEHNLIKEMADIVYVIYGMAVTYGWDLDEAVKRVHENNVGRMLQEDGTIKRREDGKIIKNPNFAKVDLTDLF